MNSSKPRAPLKKKRPSLPHTPSSFLQQGSLASFILRCAVPKKLSLPPHASKPHPHASSVHPLRMSADSGVRIPRNRSLTDLYRGPQDAGEPESTRLEDQQVRNAEQLTACLSDKVDRLKGDPDPKSKIAAVSSTFDEVISAIPSYALVLKRIKRTYEDLFRDALASQQHASTQEMDAMKDMLDLMQAEKQTLLDTVMQLRRDITGLSGKLMDKTAKVASLERKLLDISHIRDDDADSADCETQKAKSSAFLSLLSPKRGHAPASFLPKQQTRPQSRFDLPANDSLSPIIGDIDGFLSDADPLTPETRHS